MCVGCSILVLRVLIVFVCVHMVVLRLLVCFHAFAWRSYNVALLALTIVHVCVPRNVYCYVTCLNSCPTIVHYCLMMLYDFHMIVYVISS